MPYLAEPLYESYRGSSTTVVQEVVEKIGYFTICNPYTQKFVLVRVNADNTYTSSGATAFGNYASVGNFKVKCTLTSAGSDSVSYTVNKKCKAYVLSFDANNPFTEVNLPKSTTTYLHGGGTTVQYNIE